MLIIDVMYELRILLEYVLLSFFDMAFENGTGKDRNILATGYGLNSVEDLDPAKPVFQVAVLNTCERLVQF